MAAGRVGPARDARPDPELSVFFTIGHSTHTVERFIELLQGAGARFVADVRAMPRSRTNPQFNADVLPAALARAQIGYEHIAALGGLRSRRREVDPGVNAFWTNASFHNYADYATSDAFAAGLAHLREIGERRPCAVMCAEAVWWRCHRRIIADHLLAAGEDVRHIMPEGEVRPAQVTSAARVERGVLVYPAG